MEVGIRAWKTLRRESPTRISSLSEPQQNHLLQKTLLQNTSLLLASILQAVALWKNQKGTTVILKWRCPEPQSYVISISNIKISSLDFLGREGILVGRRKQDFRGGNTEQRKGLKGKGGGPLTRSKNLQQNKLAQMVSWGFVA